MDFHSNDEFSSGCNLTDIKCICHNTFYLDYTVIALLTFIFLLYIFAIKMIYNYMDDRNILKFRFR